MKVTAGCGLASGQRADFHAPGQVYMSPLMFQRLDGSRDSDGVTAIGVLDTLFRAACQASIRQA